MIAVARRPPTPIAAISQPISAASMSYNRRLNTGICILNGIARSADVNPAISSVKTSRFFHVYFRPSPMSEKTSFLTAVESGSNRGSLLVNTSAATAVPATAR